MPSPRPKWLNILVRRLPGFGRHVQVVYDAWTRAKFYRSWEMCNLPARLAFEENRPRLTEVQRQVLDGLNSRGIASVHFEQLFDDTKLWHCLAANVNRWLNTREVKDKECAYKNGGYRNAVAKEYIIQLFDINKWQSIISWDNQWLQLALRPQILDIVNTYMGLMSKLMHINLWNTIPLEYNRPLTGSQRWHRDPEDIRLVKVFLYFTDVGSLSGPLHYVANSRRGERYGSLWPQQIPGGSVPPLDAVEMVIPSADWEVCMHPAGTLIFADTTGLHMGGRASKANRVLATWEFTSHNSLWPRYFKLDRASVPQNLSTAARFALL